MDLQLNKNLKKNKINFYRKYFFLKGRKYFFCNFYKKNINFYLYFFKNINNNIKILYFLFLNYFLKIEFFFFKFNNLKKISYFFYFFFFNLNKIFNNIKKIKINNYWNYFIIYNYKNKNFLLQKNTIILNNNNNLILDYNEKNYFFQLYIKKYFNNKLIFSKFYLLYFINIFYNNLMIKGNKLKTIINIQKNFVLLKSVFKEINMYNNSRFNYYLWYLLFKFQIFFIFKREQKTRKQYIISTKIINFNKQYIKGLKLFFWLFKKEKSWNKKLQYKFFLFYELYHLKLKQITIHIDYLNIFSFLINRYKHFIQKKINLK
jgi:hypothetical protein